MKRACKTLIFILAFSMFSCLFYFNPVFAQDELFTGYSLPYAWQQYSMLYQYDNEYYSTGYNGSYSGTTENHVVINNSGTDFLKAYIREGRAGEDSVDDGYPIFVGVASRDDYDSLSFPMSNLCMSIDELTDVTASGMSNFQAFINFLPDFLNAQESGTYIANAGISCIHWRTLYSMGYYIDNMGSFTKANGTTGYVYVMRKFKGDDQITFYGALDIDGSETGTESGTIGHTQDEVSIYLNFTRYDFQVGYMTDDQNNTYRPAPNDFIHVSLTVSEYQHIYDTNMILTAYYGSNGQMTYMFDINNSYDAYVVFAQTDTTPVNGTTYNFGTHTVNVTRIDNDNSDYASQLASINQNLLTIQDLISDIQVEVVNEIYNDITNNYNIDVQSYIDNSIDDLETYWQQIQMGDPDHDVSTNDKTKIGGFKLIFTNLMDTMDNAGIGVLYFLPLMLLIIGALF